MQGVVDATLLNKVETSIERNKSLQMLDIYFVHGSVVDAILKGALGNTSLKKLTVQLSSGKKHIKVAATQLRQVRPQLELRVI